MCSCFVYRLTYSQTLCVCVSARARLARSSHGMAPNEELYYQISRRGSLPELYWIMEFSPQTLAAARRGSRFRSASPEVPGLGPATSALGTTTTERPLQHPIDQSWLICKTEHCITPLLTHPNIVERLGVVELVLFFRFSRDWSLTWRSMKITANIAET